MAQLKEEKNQPATPDINKDDDDMPAPAPRMDPEFQAICPALSDVEYKNLEESLKKEGCRDALVVWNSILLEGHNRYDICIAHDIEFKTTEIDLPDRSAAKMWIIENAFARRNLGVVQKIDLAERLRNILEQQAAQRKQSGLRQNGSIVTQNFASRDERTVNAQIGKLAGGVSRETVRKCREAKSYLNQEERERLERSDLSIHAAYRLAQDRKSEQQRTARRTSAAPTNGNDYKLTVADIRKGLPLEDSSVDFILTDPPYGMEYLSNIPGDKTWNESGETNNKFSSVMEGDTVESHNSIDWLFFFRECYRVLKNDSFLFMHCNVSFIGQHLVEMEKAGLSHKGTLVWNKGSAVGGDLRGAGKRDWEPILYLAKGKPKLNPLSVKRKGKLVIRDRISEATDWEFSLPEDEKCGHPTQKPLALARQIIGWACPENGRILDPFVGSGTTAVAANELGHRFIGFDIDPDHVSIAANRLAEEPKPVCKNGV